MRLILVETSNKLPLSSANNERCIPCADILTQPPSAEHTGRYFAQTHRTDTMIVCCAILSDAAVFQLLKDG